MTTERDKQWARLWSAAKPRPGSGVRQGAWYPVTDTVGPDRLIIDVQGRHVMVPRRLFEVEHRAPQRFTIVVRPRGAGAPEPAPDLGRSYAVCPAAGCRIAIIGRPDVMICPQCGFEGEIAWWETG